MQRLMLRVQNGSELRREALLRHFLERFAALLAPGLALREVVAVGQEMRGDHEWICLSAGSLRGVAFQAAGLEPCNTALRRALVNAQLAQQVASGLSCDAAPVLWNASLRPGDDWRVFQLCFDAGDCLCACTDAASEMLREKDRVVRPAPLVNIRIIAESDSLERLAEGVFEISARLPDLHIRGVLRLGEGGEMSVRIDGDDSGAHREQVRVRLDLGELEIGLQELLGLRPGSVIELGTACPLPCALLIGTTSLARGVIESVGTTLKVRITESVQ